MSDTFEYQDANGKPISSEEAANRYKKAPLGTRAQREAEEKPSGEELHEGQSSGVIQLDG